MSVPNLKSATLVVEPGRAVYNLTATSLTKIVDDVPADYAFFLEQVNCANKGSAAANVTILVRTGDSAGSDIYLCSKRAMQIKSQFNAAQGRAHILIEGDAVWAKLEVAGAVDIMIPYTKAHEA